MGAGGAWLADPRGCPDRPTASRLSPGSSSIGGLDGKLARPCACFLGNRGCRRHHADSPRRLQPHQTVDKLRIARRMQRLGAR